MSPSPIDDHLRGLDADRRLLLEALRRQILAVVPGAEECISYRMPAFRVHGAIVAGFQVTTKGGSYYPFSGSTLKTLAPYVRAYSQTKSALHFSADKPLPATLVRRLVKARLDEIEGRPEVAPKTSGRSKAKRNTRAR